MNFETYDLITNISALSSLIPLIGFVIVVGKKKQPNSVKLLGFVLVTAATTELATFVLYEAFRINPNPILNVYVLLQFILIVLVYRSVYTRPFLKITATMGIVAFTIFAGINAFYIEGVQAINSNTFTVSAIALVIYTCLYFYQIFKDLTEPFIERIFMFWFSTGVFMYFGTNLFLFATVDRLILSGTEQFMLSWGMHNGTNVLKNMLFTVGLYVTILPPKELSD